MLEKWKSLTLGTKLRTIAQLLAYINQIVALAGLSFGFIDAVWYQWVSFGLTLVVTILSYWYNNDWSKLAQTTGEIFDMTKDGKITSEELTEFVKNHSNTEENK